MLIQLWLASNDWIILGALIVIFSASAYAINHLCFHTRYQAYFQSFSGVVAPFFVMAATIFALTTALLGSAVWQNHRDNSLAVQTESQAIEFFINLNKAVPQLAEFNLIDLSKNYMRSAINIEWDLIKSKKRSAQADADLNALLTKTFQVVSQAAIAPAVASAVITAVDKIALARAARLSLMQTKTETVRWISVLLLALLSQIAVAAVHLEKPRAQALALVITTATIVVALGLIAMTEAPHSGTMHVTIDAMKDVLNN